MMQESLAEQLRMLRAREGLSLTEASEKIGINRHTLRDLELGKREPYGPTIRKIADYYGVTVAQLLEEPILAANAAKKVDAPDTGLVNLSPAELDTRVFGAPVKEGEEPKPVIDAGQALSLANQVRRERDDLERWLEEYAITASPARFAARAIAQEVERWVVLAQFYWLFLIDVWSKLADPRDVPYRGVLEFAALTGVTFDALRAEAKERDRARRTEDRAG
jgi:transcriptional regulator with XRE-family HTH domain